MKHFLLCCYIAALPFFCFSQGGNNNQDDPFEPFMAHLFQNVNLDEVPTGFLWDKGKRLQDFSMFNGLDTNSTNLSNIDRFGLLYATLFSTNCNPSVQIPSPTTFIQGLKSVTDKSDTIPISFLLYEYDKIKDYAFAKELLYVQDSQLYDHIPRFESPYSTKQLFAASFLQSTTVKDSLWVTLPSSFFYTNFQGVTIAGIEADFDDGKGLRNLVVNECYQVVYETSGDKKVFFKVKLSNGETIVAHTSLTKSYSLFNRYDEFSNFDFVLSSPSHSGGLINIVYAENECGGCPDPTWPCRLKKPFIIIDGFDPPQRGADGARHYDDLLERLKIVGYTGKQLGEYLQENGYDMV